MISTIAGCKVCQTLVPIMANNTSEGTGLYADRQGFQDALMIASQGISGDTLSGSLYWTVAFQESDAAGSGFANIAAADLEGGVNDHVINDAAEDPTTIVRLYRGAKRYVRILWTQTGTHTNGTPISGVIILGRPNYIPVTQPAELGG